MQGAVKAGANYVASLLAATEAKKKGYAQVLWLDAIERKWIEEVGTMNVFIRIGDEVITPPLSGTILPGVTRNSALTLLRQWGLKNSERRIELEEIFDASQKGTLKEVFGTGTAAVISPVGELCYRDKKITINQSKIGEVAQKLYDSITAIQYGEAPDDHHWTVQI